MTVYDAIVLRLSEKRGGNTLPAKAIKTTAKYLSENVGLEDAQEFSFLDLPSIVDEAWEKIESEKTPDFVRRKVARWVYMTRRPAPVTAGGTSTSRSCTCT